MTRNTDPIDPGESVQPGMAHGRWEISGVAVGGPRAVRVNTVEPGDPASVWLETPTGETCVSEWLRVADGHWNEKQEHRELNEAKTTGVLL